MLDILRKNVRRCTQQKVIYKLFTIFIMYIHKQYSQSSACDYFDTTSTLAVTLMTEIHVLLTHTFHIANDNGFQFFGYPIGHKHTDGSI